MNLRTNKLEIGLTQLKNALKLNIKLAVPKTVTATEDLKSATACIDNNKATRAGRINRKKQ